MAKVFIGVGSNINREQSICSGIRSLRNQFNDVKLSAVYESKAVGFEGDNFYNMIASLETELPPREFQEKLHDIENQFGRKRGGPRYVSRTLDLDLLLYDDLVCDEEGLQLPREDINKFAFVLLPLSEMVAELKHPVLGQSYADLWRDFDKSDQDLWIVELKL
jgi:2-amino-4-hydroxy-6-hydroxymethyldihydropteridine diphosphokinase